MKLVVNVHHFKKALSNLLREHNVSADFLESKARFYVQEILTGAKGRDIYFADVEVIDDPQQPTYKLQGASNPEAILEALNEIKGPAFSASYEYAVKNFIQAHSTNEADPLSE